MALAISMDCLDFPPTDPYAPIWAAPRRASAFEWRDGGCNDGLDANLHGSADIRSMVTLGAVRAANRDV